MLIKLCFFNAHSVVKKKDELMRFIDQHKINLFLISETWLTDKSSFSIPHFDCYRADRLYGGVCILIHKSIPHTYFASVSFGYAEAVSIKVKTDNGDITVSSVYCSPSATRAQAHDFFSKVLSVSGPSVIAGDFNSHHVAWNNSNTTRKGSDLFKLCQSRHFRIHFPKFYSAATVHENPLVSPLGDYTINSVPFKIKHKLPRSL